MYEAGLVMASGDSQRPTVEELLHQLIDGLFHYSFRDPTIQNGAGILVNIHKLLKMAIEIVSCSMNSMEMYGDFLQLC